MKAQPPAGSSMMTQHYVPSDHYRMYQEFVAQVPLLERVLGGRLVTVALVVDANHVYSEISHACRTDARSHLVESVEAGIVKAYAPAFLLTEVAKHLKDWARKMRRTVDEVAAAWAKISPAIEYLTVPEATPEEIAAAQDPKDLPYVRAYEMLNADALLSADTDLPAMGVDRIAGLKELKEIRLYVRARAEEVALKFVGFGTIALHLGAVVWLLQGIVSLAARWPEVVLLVVLAAVVLLCLEQVRRAIAAGFEALKDYLMFIAELIAPVLEQADTAAGIADAHHAALTTIPSLANWKRIELLKTGEGDSR